MNLKLSADEGLTAREIDELLCRSTQRGGERDGRTADCRIEKENLRN